MRCGEPFDCKGPRELWNIMDTQHKIFIFILSRNHKLHSAQARNQLGTPGGTKSFLRGALSF